MIERGRGYLAGHLSQRSRSACSSIAACIRLSETLTCPLCQHLLALGCRLQELVHLPGVVLQQPGVCGAHLAAALQSPAQPLVQLLQGGSEVRQ